ncbi:MAG: lysylphosphatidylglycerol synthase transmembrane domain-containing protein, partial [Candidatus Bathyarchaeia archaeon]
HAFNLQIPWDATVVVLVALGLAVSVPSAPGFMGTFHYAAMSSIMLYGVEEAQALSFAIALHGLCVLPVLVLGIPIVLSEGLSLKDISRSLRMQMNSFGRSKRSYHRETSLFNTARKKWKGPLPQIQEVVQHYVATNQNSSRPYNNRSMKNPPFNTLIK